MIRVNVVFPSSDWAALPRIRAAARALSGLPGLVEVRLSRREETAPGTASTGPVAETSFETVEEMRAALGAEAWRRLVLSGLGAPIVQAYAVDSLVLSDRAGSGHGTTDVEVAAEEAAEPEEAEPISTHLDLPLSRPALPEEDGGGNAGQ